MGSIPVCTSSRCKGGLFHGFFTMWPTAVLLGLLSQVTCSTDAVNIDLDNGHLEGKVVPIRDGRVLTQYLGVPYAAAPIGNLRFRPPEPHEGWSGVLKATRYRPACPQDTRIWKRKMDPVAYHQCVKHTHTDEDCLYLDIYIPRNMSIEGAIEPKTVMVYFHGGDFQWGTTMLHDGTFLALDGDVIVVLVNYRLGVFGFLSTEDHNADGNYGLMDQLMSLLWIKKHIRLFGGNPHRITIFGQGSGGTSVHMHILSPKTRGLFYRAISQSGSALSPSALQNDALNNAWLLAESLECPKTANVTATVECLRQVDWQNLLKHAAKVYRITQQRWRPVIDRNFLPDKPTRLMKSKQFSLVDYMLGFNSHEGFSIQDDLSIDLDKGMNRSTYYGNLRNIIYRSYKHNTLQVFQAAKFGYYADTSMQSKRESLLNRSKTLINVVGDFTVVAPTCRTASLHSIAGGRTHLYTFSHKPSYNRKSTKRPVSASYVRSTHADEVDYLFGYVRYLFPHVTDRERSLSAVLIKAWTNFAHNG